MAFFSKVKNSLFIGVLLSCLLMQEKLLFAVQRIISLSPVSTEIISILGAESELIAVTRFCNFPNSVSSKTRIGDINPSFEKILFLHPTHVVGVGNGAHVENKLKTLQLHSMIVHAPRRIDDIFLLIKEIGIFIHREKEAHQVIETLRAELKQMSSNKEIKSSSFSKKKKVLCVVGYPPLIVAGGGSYIDDMIQKAGAENVMHFSRVEYPRIEMERVLAMRPDVVIVTDKSSEKLFREQSRRFRILTIRGVDNEDILVRPGPRFIEGIRFIRESYE